MSNVAKNIANKLTGNKEGSTKQGSGGKPEEPAFSILPHPAKTNDPADLQQPGGLRNGETFAAFNTPGPYIPSEQVRNNLPEPASADELRIRQAQLDQQKS